MASMSINFFKLGGFIARHPFIFLILPLILAGCFGYGIKYLTEEQNVEKLYTPSNGRAKKDRATVKELFSQNEFSDPLLPPSTRYGKALIRVADGGNILEQRVFQEVLNLHDMIVNINIRQDNRTYSFSDICFKVHGVCNENALLALYRYDSSAVSDIDLTYPLHKKDENSVVFLGGELGGVKFKFGSLDKAQSAEALLLTYTLWSSNIAAMWEQVFVKAVSTFKSSDIGVTCLVSSTLEDVMNDASSRIIRDFCITFVIFFMFTILSCMMFDWVRSKPWLAACGVISACLALVSSFGLMGHYGIPYTTVVGAAPFLIIGIGVDDMFVMLAAWRKTNAELPVEQRMSDAFSEAAMSITITSVTDILAFGIGSFTVFSSVQIFCWYMCAAVFFDYLFQITFFGACMVLTGRREAANRNACLCCYEVESEMTSDSVIFNTNEHAVMIFFEENYGPFITRGWMEVIIVVLYAGYLALAIFGCTQLEMGLSLRNLARDNSYGANYLDDARAYFSSYGPQVALVFTEPISMWHPKYQDRMEKTLAKMEETEYVYNKTRNLSSSWLRDYLSFLELKGLKEPTKTQFIHTLRYVFLKLPAFQHYSMDIVFKDDNSDIISSRFFVTTKDLDSTNKESSMMTALREIAEGSAFPAIVYHPTFIYFDQFIEIFPHTMQNLGIAVGAMFVVSLFMIPNPFCSILVTLSLASIVTGVIGFMALFEINLDSISMTNLIICIGFSVDFSAHISYAYISGNRGSCRENAIHALYSTGMPIVQGALSTTLGTLILVFSDMYIFRTFFHTMFLVMSLGTLHGLVFLPVFLLLCVPEMLDDTVSPVI